MYPRLLIFLLAIPLFAADKPSREILELQREMAHLQEIVTGLQQSVGEQLQSMNGRIQATTEASGKVGAAVAEVQKTVQQLAREQSDRLGPLTAGQTQIGSSLGTLQQAMSDLTAAISKLQTQVGDLNNVVKVMASAKPDVPAPTAAAMFAAAEGDRTTGKLNLALQEYAEYLKAYPDTPLASSAQFETANIHYSLQDFETAAKEFDLVIQKYPDSPKLADAMFYKSKSLTALGKATQAAAACQDLKKRFPAHDLAKQCGKK